MTVVKNGVKNGRSKSKKMTAMTVKPRNTDNLFEQTTCLTRLVELKFVELKSA
jgi:hypothetical protein